MQRAVDHARANGIPVIWVQHSEDEMPIDSPYWQIVPELQPQPSDYFVRKTFLSSFEATNLDAILKELGVTKLLVAGAESNNCVRHTTHAAVERGFNVTLLADAHTTTSCSYGGVAIEAEQLISELNRNFRGYSLPGRVCDAQNVEDVDWATL